MTSRCLRRPSAWRKVDLVERTIQQVGGISLDLRPSLLDDLGLVPALRSYAQRLSERLRIDVAVQAAATIGRFEPEVETACYRIAQESLDNVAKHATAPCGFEFNSVDRKGNSGSSSATMGLAVMSRP